MTQAPATQTTNLLATHTNGLWVHTGQLIVTCKLDDGTVVKLTIPDDLVRLLNVDALEDLKYGN